MSSNSPFPSSFPRFGLSEARKTEIKRENRLKQEQYNRQKTIQFSNLLERSGKDVDDYIESQENVFLSGAADPAARSDAPNDEIDAGADAAALEPSASDARAAFVSDDGEIGDDVFSPRASGRFERSPRGASGDGEIEFDPVARPRTSLRERLLQQLRLDVRFDAADPDSPTIRRFCEEIVDRLDANGRLTVSDAAVPERNADQIAVFDAIFAIESTADDRTRAKQALDDYFAPSASKIARRFAREEFDAVVGRKSTKEERERAKTALRALFSADAGADALPTSPTSPNSPNSSNSAPFFDALFERRLTPQERESAEKALTIVRSLDPPGVGARNLPESLRARLRPDAPFRREFERLLADDVFDDFCKKRFAALSEKTGISRETLAQIYASPFPFFPSPEELFGAETAPPTIRAEVVAEPNAAGRWVVRLDSPRDALALDPYYRKMLLAKKLDAKAKDYLRKQYVEAKALADALSSRDATVLRVAKAIVDFQSDWLDDPSVPARPLTQQQIADKIGLDPSTISRACNDKWLATPRGFVPFKTFFPKAVSGDETPSGVAAKIRKIVEREDPARPFNDDAISERLRADFGVDVSRKTVQEHRERLQIPNSRERKRRYAAER